MKTKSRLKAILIAMLSLILIAQQSIAQRAGRAGSQFKSNPVIIKPIAPSINRNHPRFINSRRPMVINRFSYQPRFMPFGRITRLPFAHTRIAFMGRPFYYSNGLYYANYGNYYKEEIDVNGKRHFIIQGNDGVLNTDNIKEVTVENNNSTLKSTNYTTSLGDIVVQLPTQTKMVIINGKKLFVTPENIFYEEFVDGNVMKYKVVGM